MSAHPQDPQRRLQAVAAVLVAFAALGLVAVSASSGRTQTLTPITTPSSAAAPSELPSPGPTEAAPPAAPEPGSTWSLPRWLVTVLVLLCLAGVFAYLLRLARSDRLRWRWQWPRGAEPVPDAAGGPPPDRAMTGALAQAADAGLVQLADGPPRDAVIACWVLLEGAAATAGTARRPAETSTELTARVLREHRVSGDVLSRLADLYREARYSAHPLGEDARAAARAALGQVRRELVGTAAAAGAAAPAGTPGDGGVR